MTEQPNRGIVVGAGFMGSLHAECLLGAGRAPAAIVDTDGDRASDLAERTGAASATDLADAIAAHRPAWAIVASPDHRHREHAEVLLRHGVPVLLEKPIALSSADAEFIGELSQTSGTRVMPGHILRFEGAYTQAEDDLAAGEIGDVVHVRASRWGRLSRGRMVSSYTTPLWHFAIHDVDLIQWLGGAPVTSVAAALSTERADASVFTGIGRLANGVSFELSTGWTYPDSYPADHRAELDLHGTEGSLNFEVHDRGYSLSGPEGTHGLRGAAWPRIHGKIRGALLAEHDAFLDCLDTGADFPVPMQAGIDSIRAAELLDQAVTT